MVATKITASKNGAVAVEDQGPQPDPMPIEVIFDNPDVWTGTMWSVYATKRNATKGDLVIKQYMGALALCKARWVKVKAGNEASNEAADRVRALIDKSEDEQLAVPIGAMGLFILGISQPIEAALDFPISSFWKAL